MKKKTSKLSWFGTGAFTIIGIVYIMPNFCDEAES